MMQCDIKFEYLFARVSYLFNAILLIFNFNLIE